MESIKLRLQKAADMADALSLKTSEVISVTISGWDPALADFHIEPKTLIRIFHDLKISRSSVVAREAKDLVIIHFLHRRFRFVSSLRKPEAATFMAIHGQQRIETKRPPLRRLSKRSELPRIEAGAEQQ
jgi:hypothetical protein